MTLFLFKKDPEKRFGVFGFCIFVSQLVCHVFFSAELSKITVEIEGDHKDYEDDSAHHHRDPVVHEADGSLHGSRLRDALKIILTLEARSGHDPSEHCSAQAETQLLSGGGTGVTHTDGVDSGFEIAIGDGVSHKAHGHGSGDAQTAALEYIAENHQGFAGAEQTEACKAEGQQSHAGGVHPALAKLGHQERSNEHDCKLRNGDGVGHPAILAHVFEDVHGVIHSADGIEDDGEEDNQHGKEHNDPILVAQQSLHGHHGLDLVTLRFVAIVLNLYPLPGGEDGNEQQNHHECDHTEDGSGVAGLGVLGLHTAGEAGQKCDEEGVDEHVAQSLEDLLDVAQQAPFLTVGAHQGDHGIEGNLHEGEADSVDKVVHQEYIDVFHRCGETGRHPEQQHGGNGKGDYHPQQPYPGFAEAALCAIHDVAHDQVRHAVKQL